MRKFYALPLAAVLFAACSESTAPEGAIADMTPAYGKSDPAPPPPPQTCPTLACATWESGSGISAAGFFGISSALVEQSPSGENFAGRFAAGTPVVITVPNAAGPTVEVLFKLYIIGAWEGEAKRRPIHIFELSTQCGEGARSQVIYASISNKRGSVQSYPENLGSRGHNGGYASHTGVNILGYAGRTDLTNQFTLSGDVAGAVYTVSKSLTNSCPPGDFRIVMQSHNTGDRYNASWGIDNLSIVE